jgi:16S rRNA (cytidine1402-2'-O)-methyltransferase
VARGRLTLCATPIGNLEDITHRVVRILGQADVIACEDTRRTRKLLTHFGIPARDLVTYNEANERRRAPDLVGRIQAGAWVALVSDAGMPGLSDPGYRLVTACIEEGIEVDVAPGASAAISALALSGLPPGRFVFEGFLPRKQGERRRRIGELADDPRTLVVYESPHRIEATLGDLLEVLGDRRAVVARELTKMYEEVRRGSLSELVRGAAEDPARGEIVVVVHGATGDHAPEVTGEDLAARARALMDAGTPRKQALAQAAREMGVPRRAVFDALVIEGSEDSPSD